MRIQLGSRHRKCVSKRRRSLALILVDTKQSRLSPGTPSIPNPLEIPGDLDFYNEIIDDIVYAGHKLARILSGYEQKGE
jgi:hypothetical protein